MDFKASISELQGKFRFLTGKLQTASVKGKAGSHAASVLMPLFKTIGKFTYEHESILGIEISPHYIRICQMKNSYDRWVLTQLASACMESQFTNADIISNQELYAENLWALIDKHHIKTKNVAVSIPTSSSIIKIINIPDMEEEDFAQAASMGGVWESMVQLSGGIGEYSVDYKILNRKIKPSESLAVKADAPALESVQELNQVGEGAAVEGSAQETAPAAEEANTMDILFVAAKLSDIQIYTDIVRKAGLNPIVVDVQSNALKHAFETNPEKHKIPTPYAFVEFGADENYVYITDGEKVEISPITISEDDRQLIIKNTNDAESFKAFVQRYTEQLNGLLGTYESLNQGQRVSNIYVISATPLHVDDASAQPLINIFVTYMAEHMGLCQVSLCNFCNHIQVPEKFAKKVNAEGNLAAWAVVLGLATYKLDIFGHNHENALIDRINLLPGAVKQKKDKRTEIVSMLAMAVLIAVGMVMSAASFALLSGHASILGKEIKALDYVKAEYGDKNTEMQKLSIVLDKVKSLDKVRGNLPSNQVQILTAYKGITKAIPEGVWLSDINFTPPQNIEIKGSSINDQNILVFVNKLNETEGFKKVSLKTMEVFEEKDKNKAPAQATVTNVKKFILSGELAGNSGAEKLELISEGVKKNGN